MAVKVSIPDVKQDDIVYIREDVDISSMKECTDYQHCPYCGKCESGLECAPFHNKAEYERRYVVNGKAYPFEANAMFFTDDFASKHYGVTIEWNEIHCCDECIREYYTVHQH